MLVLWFGRTRSCVQAQRILFYSRFSLQDWFMQSRTPSSHSGGGKVTDSARVMPLRIEQSLQLRSSCLDLLLGVLLAPVIAAVLA